MLWEDFNLALAVTSRCRLGCIHLPSKRTLHGGSASSHATRSYPEQQSPACRSSGPHPLQLTGVRVRISAGHLLARRYHAAIHHGRHGQGILRPTLAEKTVNRLKIVLFFTENLWFGLFLDHHKPASQIQGFVVGTQDLGDWHAQYLSARHYS